MTSEAVPAVTPKAVRKGKKEIEKKAQALATLKIVYIPIDAVTPNTYNPNRQSDHDFDLLCRSISEDGFTQPVVAVADPEDPIRMKENGLGFSYLSGKVVIVDGEHRWRAAAKLGYKEIPVVVTPMSVEQARIATLRHNRARGSEDIELTAVVLRDLEKLGALAWAQDSLQMSDLELQRLLEDIPAPEALAAEEFSDAWNPQRGDGEDAALSELGERHAVSMTPAAIEATRAAEVRMAQAKTDKDKAQAKADLDVYRLVAVFTGEEAIVVRKVLGKAPAARILELCQEP